MILTDLDRSILFAIAAGSISGFLSSALEDTLIIKLDKEVIQLIRIVSKFFTAFTYGIISGIVVFLASLDSNITIKQLNRLIIFLSTYISTNPLYYRLTSFILF